MGNEKCCLFDDNETAVKNHFHRGGMRMKKTGVKGFTMGVFLMVIAGLSYYTYLNNKTTSEKEIEKMSETQQLLEYNFTDAYPKTVRETVKLHCKFLKNAYNDSFTEDELFTVNKQIRQMLDEELLEYNPQDQQLQGLKEEIARYKDNKQKYIGYKVAESSQIKYNTQGDREYAKVKVTITLQVGTNNQTVDEEYILRKDEEDRWKILGWQAENNQTIKAKGDTE